MAPRQVRSPYDANKDWLDDARGEAAGGGGGIIHRAKKVLTNAQIITLPSTLVEITPDPPADCLAVFLSGFARSNVAAGVYGGISENTADDFSFITIGYNGSGNYASDFVYSSILLTDDSGTSPLTVFSTGHNVDFTLSTFPVLPSANGTSNSYLGQGFGIKAHNQAGNFSGGHVDNWLTVGLAYLIFNTLTGEME